MTYKPLSHTYFNFFNKPFWQGDLGLCLNYFNSRSEMLQKRNRQNCCSLKLLYISNFLNIKSGANKPDLMVFDL
jgi:hypothetical protein